MLGGGDDLPLTRIEGDGKGSEGGVGKYASLTRPGGILILAEELGVCGVVAILLMQLSVVGASLRYVAPSTEFKNGAKGHIQTQW